MRTSILIVFLAVATGFGITGCHRNTSDNEAPDLSSYHPEKPPASEFERALRDVREGHFKFMWVFTRLDGGVFTKEDGDILRKAAPKVVDWVGTDDKKTFVAGSNFDIEPAQMTALKKRFKIENYSGK